MPLADAFTSRLSGPAGRVLDAPIRALVHEILREQGYASPAELQALRDDAQALAGRLARAESRLTELKSAQEATLAELKAAYDALSASRAEFAAAAVAMVPTASTLPVDTAPRGACTVPDCEGTLRSKGFCSAHYQQWRRGTLHNFVGQDGHILIGKRTFRVSDAYAGQPAELDGEKVLIGGKVVSAR